MEPIVHSIYESVTGTWQYVVADRSKRAAVIIDPVLDYDQESGIMGTNSADKLLKLITDNKYKIHYILETHAHADHISASRYLQTVLEHLLSSSPEVCIGHRIVHVQQTFGAIYSIPEAELENAFDRLLQDEEELGLGSLVVRVIHLPGHTPDHVGYIIGSNVFTGDSIFNPDVGSARCDFPGGSASILYQSTRKLLTLPGNYRLYTGHDYPPSERDIDIGPDGLKAIPFTTVEKQRLENKHLKAGTAEEDFVNWRNERDSGLQAPKLLVPSIRTNIRGGRLPRSSEDGFTIAKVPNGVVRV
ncbi:metallo-beta-lactamase superfamily protein [Umbelopsis sp. PMI_123]|nr:metallo-beta-lactamase superfamily protein [Umbelopsis sp. PMI_123]